MGRYAEVEMDLSNSNLDAGLGLELAGPFHPVVRNAIADATAQARHLSFLSHDLSNNLNLVSLHLGLLKQRIGSSTEFSEELQLLDLAEQTIGQTVRGMRRLLTYQRLRGQGKQIDLQLLNLPELIHRAATPFMARARLKGISVVFDLADNMIVRSDSDLLMIVLQNLLDNSVKFSSKGIIRLSAKADPESSGGWMLWVSDEGPGIPQCHIERIFDAFYRGESKSCDGVGLGLAIALEAARTLGAHLSVDSQVGIGSTFLLRFF
jgi:signal transduction histidine kinase